VWRGGQKSQEESSDQGLSPAATFGINGITARGQVVPTGEDLLPAGRCSGPWVFRQGGLGPRSAPTPITRRRHDPIGPFLQWGIRVSSGDPLAAMLFTSEYSASSLFLRRYACGSPPACGSKEGDLVCPFRGFAPSGLHPRLRIFRPCGSRRAPVPDSSGHAGIHS